MIPDSEMAMLCVAVYGKGPTVQWDYFEAANSDDGVCFGIKKYEDEYAVIFRGSMTAQDWFRDFDALVWPFNHSQLGPVHPGFYDGLDAALAVIQKNSGPKRQIGGHSLGAGRASIMTGLLKIAGEPPTGRMVIGEPRPGFQQLADLIGDIPGASYRNGDAKTHDYVTDVPLNIDIENYVHPTALIDVCAAPKPDDHWGPLAWHHEQLYQQALTAKTA